jgi:post-segregation antitoxin (ccd killing protein)
VPRLQVYLPDDLHAEVKARGLPASELLQAAVRAEIRRLDQLAALDAHVAGLAEEVRPTPAQRERAEVVARRLSRRRP